MNRPELSFVDATILTALVTPEPASDRVLRTLRYGACSWITSEISVAVCLANLERRGLALHRQQACLDSLLLVLRHGIGLRPLPLQALRPQHPQPLPPLALLQLQTAYGFTAEDLELVIEDEMVEKAVEAIRGSAHTGRIGDGKIFVSNIDDAIRIRTGERGDAAV